MPSKGRLMKRVFGNLFNSLNFNSLNKKMAAFLVLILGASLAITTFFSIEIERSNTLQSAREKVRSLAAVIQYNMLPAMEEGRCKSLAALIHSLTPSSEYMLVRVFDSDGRVIASTREKEEGHIFDTSGVRRKKEDIILMSSDTGNRIFAAVRPFYNEAKCNACHDNEKEVLAYLNVNLSLSSIEAQLRSSTYRQIFSGFGVIIAMCGAMFLFFSRTIKRRILDVSTKMAEVEKGNFDVLVPVNNGDELGLMAKTFNFMVNNLNEMRKKDKEQQKLLVRGNEDLRKKMEEQNILYESSKAINNFLQIEEILRETLERVTKSLGFDRAVLALSDEKGEALVGKWSIGIDEEIVRQVRIPKEDIKGVLLETLEKGEPLIARDASTYPASDIVNLLPLRDSPFVCVPLTTREQTLGFLLADKLKSENKEISEDEAKLLMTFISHVSIAIENAILYQKLERKVDFSQRQLKETNEQLSQKVDELNQIRSFNESVLQNLYGGIVTYTLEGKITFINKSQLELTGWTETEVLGESIYDIFCGGKHEQSVFQMNSIDNNGFSAETEILKKSGEKIPAEVFLSRLKDQNGNVIGVTGIFRDITEKKEIEERMRRMDKLATLGQLASGIAHEIKNPLAGIGSAIQVLSSAIALDDMKKEVVKEILKQIHRLDETIKNLLSFAKPGQPRLAPANLNEILQIVIFLTAQQAKKQNVEINLDFKIDIPQIMIDPQQIQQAILNVVLNGIEAMPQGGVLNISVIEKYLTGPLKKAKQYLSIIVSDTGTGIPENIMAQIFNPFYTTKPSGTGLGLSITQRIVEQHNGTVDVKSKPEEGTIFTIDIPME